MAKEIRQQGRVRTGSFAEGDLKVCDLCGSLNLHVNEECFVCSWHGHFETSPQIVRAAHEIAIRQFGRLELQHVTDISKYHAQPTPITSRFSGFGGWIERFWNWLSG